MHFILWELARIIKLSFIIFVEYKSRAEIIPN